MNKSGLPDVIKHCSCGREHTCGIKHIEIGSGALNSAAGLIEPFSRAAVAADENTYAVCGQRLVSVLGDKALSITILDAGNGSSGVKTNTKTKTGTKTRLIPDEAALERVRSAAVSAGADVIVGIGSGVINDICKYTAYELGIPYVIVCTAPSMDGYASSGAALILDGMKVTLPAREPYAIVADTDILVSAPIEMIRAGYGDIIGKFSCLSDWKLSCTVNGEYFCQLVYDMTKRNARLVADSAEKLLARDPGAIETLMRALIEVGVGMAYTGNSRSASGSEHHLSHFFEITGILEGRESLLHGIDVGYSALMVQKLREQVLEINTWFDEAPAREKMSVDERKRRIAEIYGPLAPSVTELQQRTGFYDKDFRAVYREKREKIRSVLEETPSSAETEAMLVRAGYDIPAFFDFYGRKKLADAALFAKDLKDRYTFLWLYWELFQWQ